MIISPIIQKLNFNSSISIINSFFKICKIESFLPGDVVEAAGHIPTQIYLFLEGDAVHISFDNEKVVPLKLGQFFGCARKNARNYSTIKARKVCKFAYISEAEYEPFRMVFPKFAYIVAKEDIKYKVEMLKDLEYFKLKKTSD